MNLKNEDIRIFFSQKGEPIWIGDQVDLAGSTRDDLLYNSPSQRRKPYLDLVFI